MAEANAHYYATRDPLGASGDFVTAPEISQMFGEMIGLWFADMWQRAGRPTVHYVELGPGRGTLAADALRAMAAFKLVPQVHFVEISPVLRAKQADHVPRAIWHEDMSTLPEDAPLLVVANEFFDALPVRQLVKSTRGWRERMVGHNRDGFGPVAGPIPLDDYVPPAARTAATGSVIETSPAAVSLMRELARRVKAQDGAALVIDYGYLQSAPGDTLQAVRGHAFADPFVAPGASDLTAHVDFGVLVEAAREAEVIAHGPATQGDFLTRLGLGPRAAMLSQSAPAQADALAAAHHRLTHADEMGILFKALALTAPGWPSPEGFA